jgi:ubiquinone/menaquinone biosynthesis C-methylase UbiE
VGSGAGLDSLVAVQMAGEHGSVIGVDMTPEMLQKARRNAQRMRATNVNVKFRKGLAEALPLPDGVADVVISNGIFNLVPDKQAALRETFRVLKPSGRFYLSDIVTSRPVSDRDRQNVDLWTD